MQIINGLPLNQQFATQQGENQLTQDTVTLQVFNNEQTNKQAIGTNQDTVTLSPMGKSLSAQALGLPETRPNFPLLPNDGDKLEKYVAYKKVQTQYQIYTDMAGIATGNNHGLSPVTTYYLSNNDEARTAVVGARAQQQHVGTMRTYAAVSQQANQWYE